MKLIFKALVVFTGAFYLCAEQTLISTLFLNSINSSVHHFLKFEAEIMFEASTTIKEHNKAEHFLKLYAEARSEVAN